MGLLDEMFPKKEPTRHRVVKNTPAKKPPDKSTRSSTAEKSTPSQTNSNSSIFNSLRRVQGALSPALKKKSAPKQNAKVNTETKSVEKDTIKDKDKIKEKESDKERKLWFRSSSKVNLRKEPIKSSATSLAVGSGLQKGSSSETKKKRPATVFSDTNVTFRRGQNTKIEGQNLGENNLSRTSSVTNLDAEPKSAKGARPRKSSSRDRLDKIGESKKNDKKGITRNNNKLDSGENPYPSVDSLPEQELSHLRKQLQEMAQEKSNLALQLGEQKGQLNILQKEIQKLKEESNIQLEHLTEENTALRNRLRDVAHSPLSDNEKQQLLFESHRHHSSAPASIATNIIDDGNGGDTTCTTPDWDKHSSSNVSEVSVACLQDKINQMQETHYSTNEELQATLQELTDLQRQLTELQQENERLNEEKTLMFDSLCRQTERLNDSRSEVESLKQLLYQEKDDTGQFESAVEREQKLVELLKSSQEEREGLLVKIEQLNNEIQESRIGIKEKDEQISQLRDRVRTLECTLDAKHAEHKLLDQELAQAKDQCSGKQIEINRLTDLLDNARTKINELEQDRALSDKSELDELLDNARKEKDSLESEVAHLKEQLAISKNEIEKLKEQVSILQEECKVTRNNAKTTQSDLEYKCEKLLKEKNVLNEQLQEFQEALNELQVQSQCQLEDKRQLSAVLSETQRNLSETEQKNAMLENEVHELKKQRAEENEEWEKFQDDLLTSVRVANDFKTEAQQDLQRMIIENKQYRERERQLKAEIEKLKGGTLKSSDKENQEMDIFIKRPNRNKDRAKKAAGAISEGSKSDKTFTAPQTVSVKRRENKTLKSKRLKTLSVEEEMLLNSLHNYHAEIDKTIPDEFLTEEQKVIRKLKIIYEDDYLKIKPVAPKAKDQLAISKPLLDSVLTNPKLMEILKNPKVKTVDDMATFEKEAPEIRNIIREIDRNTKGKSDSLASPINPKRISIIGRSMSVDQLHQLDPIDTNLKLYRTVETEDLTEEELPLSIEQRVSSLVPSDSVSNYKKRYSDFATVVNSQASIFNQNVKYSTLEKIVKSIPKNTPESKLTKEQQFALKLLTALEERKNTLKKSDKAKTLPISKPTEESVLRNPKLKEIIYDPDIKDIARRKSDVQNQTHKEPPKLRISKSYDDITFSFDEKSHVSMYHSPSDSSLSSAEFNIVTNEVGPYNENSFKNTLRRSLPTPNIPQNVELVTFARQKSVDKNKSVCNVQEAEIIIHKVSSMSEKEDTRPNQEKVPCKTTESPVDSLMYNDTLKKKFGEVEGDVTVDLLQQKIKKVTENNISNKNITTAEKPIVMENITTPKRPVLNFAKVETIAVSKVDKHDSLNYNDTLERAKQRGPYKLQQQEQNKNSSPVSEASEAIKNITKKFQVIQKLIDEDRQKLDSFNKEKENINISNTEKFTEDNDPAIERNINKYQVDDHELNDDIDGDIDYDYHQILRENRAGVTSPLNYRLSYRGVVNEIKKRFSTDTCSTESLEEDNEDHKSESDIEIRNKSTGDIDKEMEHIFEHYLKTRVSQVIKQTEDKPNQINSTPIQTEVCIIEDNSYNSNKSHPEEKKETKVTPELISDMRQTENETNITNISKLSPKELKFSDDSYFELKDGQVTNIKLFDDIDGGITKHSTEKYEPKFISKHFLLEKRRVHLHPQEVLPITDNKTYKEQHSNSNSLFKETKKSHSPLKQLIDFEPLEKAPVFPISSDDSNLNIENIPNVLSEQTKSVSEFSPSIQKTASLSVHKILTDEELDIIRNVKNQPHSRPLSEINDDDLKLIQSLTSSYLTGTEYKSDTVSAEDIISPETEKFPSAVLKEKEMDLVNISNQQYSNPVIPISDLNQEELDLSSKLYTHNTELRKTADPNIIQTVKSSIHEKPVTCGESEDDNSIRYKDKVEKSSNAPYKNDEKLLNKLLDKESNSVDVSITPPIPETNQKVIIKTSEVSDRKSDGLKIIPILPRTREKTSSNEKIVTTSEADNADDLETLLGKMSSSRNRTVKKKIHKTMDLNRLPGLDIEQREKLETTNKYEINRDPPNTNDNFKLENKGIAHILNKSEKMVPKGKIITSDISSPTLNEAGTLDRNQERHLILYRNKKSVPREVKSLHFEPAITTTTTDSLNRPKSAMGFTKNDKKVKSFAQHFERLSQQRYKKPDPVYANISFLSRTQRSISPLSIRITEKKPLPVPRSKNQVDKESRTLTDSCSYDSYVVMEKMTEGNKNLSETGQDDVVQEISSTLVNIPRQDGLPSGIEKPEQDEKKLLELESQNRVLSEVADAIRNEEENATGLDLESSKLGIKKSEKFSDKMDLPPNVENVPEKADEGRAATSSYSVIAVTNTAEKLDIRNPSDAAIHTSHNKSNASNLNLINLESLETQSFDETHSGVSKTTPENKLIGEINKPKMGYDITYLGEVSDTESFDDPKLSLDGEENSSKPKIIDFVPLDDATKPFFANSNNIPDYNTLEREKVYHVLQSASASKVKSEEVEKIADDAKTELKLEDDQVSNEPIKEVDSKSVEERKENRSKEYEADLNVELAESLIIEKPHKENLPSTHSSYKSEENKITYSAAKKVFQELEAKNITKVASKDIPQSESVKSSIDISVTRKSTTSTESKSAVNNNDEETTEEEIDKTIE
ncbi:centromere-associated protein E-like isoform X2 [Diorhabda sublineata]|uniref:centromere-associated protein E-like isoform X2 n=1 Tax=Diorhabda sublineata TaxID=1163346 RepID=UPI0024E0AF2A|nr:centromere-associated protein E-like isoform X2 [Diorhabda sublineata]